MAAPKARCTPRRILPRHVATLRRSCQVEHLPARRISTFCPGHQLSSSQMYSTRIGSIESSAVNWKSTAFMPSNSSIIKLIASICCLRKTTCLVISHHQLHFVCVAVSTPPRFRWFIRRLVFYYFRRAFYARIIWSTTHMSPNITDVISITMLFLTSTSFPTLPLLP